MRQVNIYWLSVDLKFKNEIPIYNFDLTGKDYAKGAVMSFGITAENEGAVNELLLESLKADEALVDVNFDVEVCNMGIIDSNDVNKEIYGDEDIADTILRSPYEPGL